MRMLLSIRQAIGDLSTLLFPDICLCCNEKPPSPNETTCFSCRRALPRTNYHNFTENSFAERFFGRLPKLKHAGAAYQYRKGNSTQKLIKQLKYNGKKEVGISLGREYAVRLQDKGFFEDIDVIIPVPLHPRKEKLRGYNQSEMFAAGIAEIVEKPVVTDVLIRTAHTRSQTKKDKFDRTAVIGSIFSIKQTEKIHNKHVLLVDDVLTTGATLEACGSALCRCAISHLSLATIAIAMQD